MPKTFISNIYLPSDCSEYQIISVVTCIDISLECARWDPSVLRRKVITRDWELGWPLVPKENKDDSVQTIIARQIKQVFMLNTILGKPLVKLSHNENLSERGKKERGGRQGEKKMVWKHYWVGWYTINIYGESWSTAQLYSGHTSPIIHRTQYITFLMIICLCKNILRDIIIHDKAVTMLQTKKTAINNQESFVVISTIITKEKRQHIS